MSIIGCFEDSKVWAGSISTFLQKETPSSNPEIVNLSLSLLNLRKKVDVTVSYKELRSLDFISALRLVLKDLQKLLNLRRRVHIFLGEDLATSTNGSTYCTNVFLYCYRQLRKYLRECHERRAEAVNSTSSNDIFVEMFQPREFLLDHDDNEDDRGLGGTFEGKQSFDKRTVVELVDSQNHLKLSLVYMFVNLEDICVEVRKSWIRLRKQDCHILEPIVVTVSAMHLVRKLQLEFKAKYPDVECFLKDVFGEIIPDGDIFSAREAKAFMSNQTVREFASICTAIEQFRKVFALDKKPSRWKPFYEDSGEPLTFEPSRLVKFYDTDLCILLDRVEDSLGDSFPQDCFKNTALCTSMLLFPLNDAFLSDWYQIQSIFFIWAWVTSLQCLSDPVYMFKSKTVYLYRRWRRKLNTNYFQSRLAGVMPLIDAVYTSPLSYFNFHELYQSEDNQFFCGWNDVLYNNPLICGSLLLDSILLQRDAVQVGGDGFFSLFRSIAFLYVALRQEGYLQQPIPLVDLIISAFEEQGLLLLPNRELYFALYLHAEGVPLATVCDIKVALSRATQKDQIEIAKKKLKIALEVSRRKFQQHTAQQSRGGAPTNDRVHPNKELQRSSTVYSIERHETVSFPHSPYRCKTLELLYERKLPFEGQVFSSNEPQGKATKEKISEALKSALKLDGRFPQSSNKSGFTSGDTDSPTISVTSEPGTPSVPNTSTERSQYHDCRRILQAASRTFQYDMKVTRHLSIDCNLVLSKLLVFFSVLVQRMPIVSEGMVGIPMPSPIQVPSSTGASCNGAPHMSSTSIPSPKSQSTDLHGRYLYALGDSVVTWALPLLDLAPTERTSFQEELLRSLSSYFVDVLGRGDLSDPGYVDNKFCLFPEARETQLMFAEEFGHPLPAADAASYTPIMTAAGASLHSSTDTESVGGVTVPLALQQSFQDIVQQLQRLKSSTTTSAIISSLSNAASTIESTFNSGNMSNKQQQQRSMQSLVRLMPSSLAGMLSRAANALEEDDEDLDPITKSLLPIWGRSREYHRDVERIKQRIKQNPAVLHLRAPLPNMSANAAMLSYPTILHHAVQLKDLEFLEWMMSMQTYQPAIHPSVLIPPDQLVPSAQLSLQQQLIAQMQQVLAAYTPVQVAVQSRWKEGVFAMLSFSAHRDVDVPTGPFGNTLMHEAFATGDDHILDVLYFYDFTKYIVQENAEGLQPRDLYPPERLVMWKAALKSKQKVPFWIESDDVPVDMLANMATVCDQFHTMKDDPHVLEKLTAQMKTLASKFDLDRNEKEDTSLQRQARAVARRQLHSPLSLPRVPSMTPSLSFKANREVKIVHDPFDLSEENAHPDFFKSMDDMGVASAQSATMHQMLDWLGTMDKFPFQPSATTITTTTTTTSTTTVTSSSSSSSGIAVTVDCQSPTDAAALAVAQALKSVVTSSFPSVLALEEEGFHEST